MTDPAEHYAWVLFEANFAKLNGRSREKAWAALDAWLDSLPRDLSPHAPLGPTTPPGA